MDFDAYQCNEAMNSFINWDFIPGGSASQEIESDDDVNDMTAEEIPSALLFSATGANSASNEHPFQREWTQASPNPYPYSTTDHVACTNGSKPQTSFDSIFVQASPNSHFNQPPDGSQSSLDSSPLPPTPLDPYQQFPSPSVWQTRELEDAGLPPLRGFPNLRNPQPELLNQGCVKDAFTPYPEHTQGLHPFYSPASGYSSSLNSSPQSFQDQPLSPNTQSSPVSLHAPLNAYGTPATWPIGNQEVPRSPSGSPANLLYRQLKELTLRSSPVSASPQCLPSSLPAETIGAQHTILSKKKASRQISSGSPMSLVRPRRLEPYPGHAETPLRQSIPIMSPPPHYLTPGPDSPVHPATGASASVGSFVLMNSPIGCRASRYQKEAPKTRHKDALYFCEVEGCNIDRSKGFTTRGSLQRHMKDKHSNLEPVVCSTCQRRFADSTSLPRHVAKLHPGVPLPTKAVKSKKKDKAKAR